MDPEQVLMASTDSASPFANPVAAQASLKQMSAIIVKEGTIASGIVLSDRKDKSVS